MTRRSLGLTAITVLLGAHITERSTALTTTEPEERPYDEGHRDPKPPKEPKP
jgi:hypothetical protein